MSQSETHPDRSQARLTLSALADGQASADDAAAAFEAWRHDDEMRATWHAWHLIGDVMRSDDLSSPPEADCRLLQSLRARLAEEPVVLAPTVDADADADTATAPGQAQPALADGARRPAGARHRWQAPLAAAAGFLAVIVGINVVRAPAPQQVAVNGPSRAAEPAVPPRAGASREASPVGTVVATAATATAPARTGEEAQADSRAAVEQLAPYVAAHRQSTMNAALQMPGVDLRNVSFVQTAP